jgi:hypothetical protein
MLVVCTYMKFVNLAAVTLMMFSSLPRKLNSGNSATACLHRLANLQLDSNGNAAAAAWVMAAGGSGGVSAEDVWQIIGSFSTGSSSSSSSGGGGGGVQCLHEVGGSWVHAMASSMLCGGPDSSADASLANRSFPQSSRAVILSRLLSVVHCHSPKSYGTLRV